MVHCVVPMCTSTSIKNKNISFHQFPCSEDRRQIWIKNISREGSSKESLWVPNQYSTVCGLHFRDSDYKQGTKNKILKLDAAPTIFSFYPESAFSPPLLKHRASKKRWLLKLAATPRKNLLQRSNTTRTKSFEEKREVQVKNKRCDNLTRKSTKISLFPSSIRIEINQSPTELNNNLSFEDSNGDVSLEQERTETMAAGDLGEQSSKPLPSLVSVHKASLTFAEVLDVLYRQRRISEPAKNKLKTALPKGEDSAHVVEPTAEGQKRQYSTQLRNFALSFYFYSYKAYTYAWRNYNTFLPPPSALCK